MRNILHLLCAVMLVAFATSALADTLPSNRHIFVHMDNGAEYDDDYSYYSGDDPDAYYIKADGGGLNQLHITNAYTSANGQDNVVYTDVNGDASGEFWISTTGGRGFNDQIILQVSVKPDAQGNLPANLSVNIKSNGYNFIPGDYTNATVETAEIDYTFDETDFATKNYGPQAYKPGPGTIDTWTLPLYTNQTDFTNGEKLLFIDLNLGNIKAEMLQNPTEGGSIRVEYDISGLTTSASFNALAWCLTSNQGQGISWVNNTLDYGTSSYRIINDN